MHHGPVKTTCPYCGVGCGVIATPKPGGGFAISGDRHHPANFGRLCSKGTALGETLSLEGRLLYPLVNGVRAAWSNALDLVAERFSEAIAAHGPDSVALYVSGQLLTEDYYVANKLMKGFIGSANIDTNSRLCMASSVAGHRRAFGSDTVPGTYEDLEQSDLVVLVGSNLAWCHPVLFQRLMAARESRGTKIVVIDPRRTASCESADLHLPIAPGTDVALFNGLLSHLAATGRVNTEYVDAHTEGLAEALKCAAAMDLAGIARLTGLEPASIARFYAMFAATERVVTVYSQGVNQSSAGTDKVNAILNCHLATGRIGRPGSGPFSITGQPNAMGGRETGGLANMLAAHMELSNPDHRRIVQSFWRAPALADRPGLKAVDLFDAVRDGRIKALWIMATNPVDSMPDADRVREALSRCPFVVVSDIERCTDTTAMAHVLLPSAAWGEKDGTVTNSERRISRQRPFLMPPGEARPDWWQLCEVGTRLGFADAFDYAAPFEIFAEYAQLTGTENGGTRDLDLSAYAEMTDHGYESLAPFQWPAASGQRNGGDTRFFAAGGFFTPDRRGRFVATPYRAPAGAVTSRYPLVLNTGRIRDQWHTMTRTGKAPRLMAHMSEPFVEIHPEDAATFGVSDGAIAELSSASGSELFRVKITDAQLRGTLFTPMHWTGQFASRSRTDALTNAFTDPVSGQPELKHTPVAIRPLHAAWHGVLLTVSRPSLAAADYVAISPIASGYQTELAATAQPADWDEFARALIGSDAAEVLAYHDLAAGQHRYAAFAGDRLAGLLFTSFHPLKIVRSWAAEQLGSEIAPSDRLRLLAGRPGAGAKDKGAIVCACFEVGRHEIIEAVAGGCSTTADIGTALKAGTNCGSCRSEIGRLIHEARLQKAG